MRKILLTALSLALVTLGMSAKTYTVKTSSNGALTAGQTLSATDDPVTVTSIYAAKKNKDMSKTTNFPDGTAARAFGAASSKMRLSAAPTTDAPDGTSQTDNTAFKLVVSEALTDLKLYAEASGDTRTFTLFNTATGEGVVGTNQVGDKVGGSNLGYVVTWKNVAAGTYTLYNTGFGGGFCGIVYNTPDDLRPAAKISWDITETTLKVGEALATVPQIVNTENLTLSFNSDNTAIATVDEATGVITYQNPTEPGVCHISATYTAPDETSTYKTTTVTTTITVESSIVEVVAHQWVAYETQASFPLTVKVDTKDAFAANVDILSDEALKVSTVYAANQAKYGTTMFGYPFETGAQLGRVDKAPSADNLTGTEKAGNTPLVVIPAKDLKFVVFIRRQAVEQGEPVVTTEGNTVTTTHMWGMTENDGKGIYAVSQTAPADKLPQQQIFGSYMNEQAQGSNDYLCAAVVWELKAGETYTIWTRGTTICMFALGYILPEQPEAPAAPQIFIGENEHTEGDINLNSASVTLTFKAAEGHNVYYNFTKTVTEPETPAAAPAAEPVATLEHNGETFTLVPAEGLTLSENGTLKVLAHNPATDARSEVVVRGVSGGTTAITEIEAAGAEAVYYNLQGQPVAQPAQGLYIRVQNGKAQKVMVK